MIRLKQQRLQNKLGFNTPSNYMQLMGSSTKYAAISLLLLFMLCACATCSSKPHTTTDSNTKLNQYFERYCDYTGNMGIGFYASHTYDYEFRQRLKMTQDPEMKRLFVLYHLYREVDWEIDRLEQGVVSVGKGIQEKMSPEEKASIRTSVLATLDDLSSFDPGDPQNEIAKYRQRLSQQSK